MADATFDPRRFWLPVSRGHVLLDTSARKAVAGFDANNLPPSRLPQPWLCVLRSRSALTSRPTHVFAVTRKACYLGSRRAQLLVFAAIHAPGRARLPHLDLGQPAERRRELTPDPPRENLARRVLEPRHLVEIAVVQSLVYRAKRRLQIGEIHYPPRVLTHGAFDRHPDLKRVTVQPSALVPIGHVRQAMRGLERKILVQ